MPSLRIIAAVALAAILPACTVGPDFSAPKAPAATRYTPPSEAASVNGDAGPGAPRQTLVTGDKIAADWWTLFRSPEIDDLVKNAIAGNHSLEAAKARLAAAHSAIAVAAGGLYPQVNLGASVAREKISTATFGLPPGSIHVPPNFNLYSVGPTASYSLDIFGGTHRLVEERTAQAEVQAYQLDAAYLTLTGNTVSEAVRLAAIRAQLRAVDDIVEIDRQNLDLVRKSNVAGVAPDSDVVSAESQLAADETLRPPLEQQLSQSRHALAVLLGRTPGDWAPPDLDLASLTLPGELPLSLPSSLVRQRPDILAAEARLHAASAQIGVVTAQLYPDITLSASASQVALQPSKLFDPASLVWSVAASVTAPIFHGGTLEAQRRVAQSEFQGVLADYEQTVVSSFGQVADLLQGLAHDAQLLRAQQRALDAASNSVRLQRLGYSGGGSGILTVLDAQRQYEQARLGYVRAQAQRHLDTVQLFVAMGGGWWNAAVTPQQDVALRLEQQQHAQEHTPSTGP
jgi:NodT family efflux transporter outer membrane factor (OMF) lipoprotein